MGKIERIQVGPEDRVRLEKLVRDLNTPQKVVWRARIVVLAGEDTKAGEIARQVGKEDIVGLYLNPPDKALVFRLTRKVKSRRWTEPNQAC